MTRVIIAGIGNVLLGDDGVGPYVVQLLKSRFELDDGVEVEDLGTPALDIIDYFAGKDALIVVDSVDNGAAPGTVTLYRKDDLIRHAPAVRMDPHSPALSESLFTADLMGYCPGEVLLVGVSGANYNAGCSLSPLVRDAAETVIAEVLRELDQLGIKPVERVQHAATDIWWARESVFAPQV